MSLFSFGLAEISWFNLANTFALDISAWKFGVELASHKIMVHFGTLIVFEKLGTTKII